jgi:hypothetical protein
MHSRPQATLLVFGVSGDYDSCMENHENETETNKVACPACREPIHKDAVKCPHCHVEIEDSVTSGIRGILGLAGLGVFFWGLGAIFGWWD